MTTTSKRDPLRPDVLIVDDDANSRLYLKTLLAKAKVSSIDALDGIKALELIERNSPRIIVSDIRMPRMNGYELLHRVRKSDSDYADTPFVLLTGLADGELADAAEKFGVSAFFAKPLDAEKFCETIRELLATPPETERARLAGTITDNGKRLEPERAETIERLHEIIAADGGDRQTFGHIICLGTEEIRRRVGEAHWGKLRDTVSRLMLEAVEAVCRPEDVYLGCDDGSVIIVFGDNDLHHAEAAAAKAAKHVSDTLFGSDELNGVKVTSIVHTADGYITEGKKNVSEIVDSLLKLAQKHVVGRRHGNAVLQTAPAVPKPAASKGTGKTATQSAIPSFRNELLSRLDEGEQQPIEFKFLPVWDIQHRIVNIFTCLPSRARALGGRRDWGYPVLGKSPSLSDIVELDIACLEYGLIEIMEHLSAGKPVFLSLSIHFETLASKNSREKLLSLLREIPESIRKHVAPILTYAPDGIPEMRIREITSQLRSMVHILSVEVFPQDEGTNLMRTVTRMRGGGIECILAHVADDRDRHEIQVAQKIGERVRQLGGRTGVTGIRNPDALMDLAYSPLDYCTGKAIGGPYERAPEPFTFDAKTLEQLTGSR